MPFLTAEQTGGPFVFALRHHRQYLAVERGPGSKIHVFDIEHLEKVLGQGAGETWQEHASLILLACMNGKLFEWLDTAGGAGCEVS